MRAGVASVLVALSVVACGPGGGGTGGVAGPVATLEPTSTPADWSIEVLDASYTSKTFEGGDIVVTVKVRNTGTASSPGTTLQFSDLNDYADFNECTPDCSQDEFFGVYLNYPGIKPGGKTATFKSTWVAKKVGVAKWHVCVYDGTREKSGNQIGCYDAKTTIR